ncbi:MAG TPA: crotonase/enoyl-CoA hydratase family protein [Burkholderiales bacterium]|nr:crotonase/enoyl-CoA hydratase family protein [Burkholderiales bacterium]
MPNADGRITRALEDGLYLIGIDRPAKLNGFTPQMMRELGEAYTAFEREPQARCALVYAEGAHFTAGLDLPKMAPQLGGERPLAGEGEIDPFGLRAPFRSKPVVFAVQGICYTLGIELMLAADVVVASADCRFAQLEVRRGLLPTGGATIRMPERAGWGNAMRWLLTGDEFDAPTALRLGFVQEVVPAGRQLERAREIARVIAQQAPLALAAVIASARSAGREGAPAAIAQLGAAQRALLASEDFQEGLRSFKDKGTPRFRGR